MRKRKGLKKEKIAFEELPIPAQIRPGLEIPKEDPYLQLQKGFERGFPSPEMFRLGFFDQGIKHLFDKNKIEMIGRMSPDLVQVIRRLRIIANTYDIKEWKDTIEDFISVGLSESGKSREETLKMVGAMTRSKEKSKENKRDDIEPRQTEESL